MDFVSYNNCSLDFIFVLKCTNNVKLLSIFPNIDKALDELAIYIKNVDSNLNNYSISKYVVDIHDRNYYYDKSYNLNELINIKDILTNDKDDSSYYSSCPDNYSLDSNESTSE